MKIKDLARPVEGIVDGDGELDIKGCSGIETAKPGDRAFAVDEKRVLLGEKSAASCILVDETAKRSSKTLIRVKNPKLGFLPICGKFHAAESREAFIHPSASIADSAERRYI